jgi:hypothetical protein
VRSEKQLMYRRPCLPPGDEAALASVKAREQEGGLELLRFLASSAAAAVIAKPGLMPVSGR